MSDTRTFDATEILQFIEARLGDEKIPNVDYASVSRIVGIHDDRADSQHVNFDQWSVLRLVARSWSGHDDYRDEWIFVTP